ncbi:hypothetical protein [uncultured Faecalicoccus sp.]|uniref:hypothetical protein n=1 Tax=uncultured Faecalicoccus sp. TaxID=1971760 RepID=UPI00258A91BD|nr:hypothetical protein [uncultured Faecalicoccus sp.]
MSKKKSKKKSKLQIAQDKAQAATNETNNVIGELGKHTESLYKSLTSIQVQFDKIRSVPSEQKLRYEELKQIRLNWKQQADKIDKDYKNATVKNAGAGAAGTGLGVAVVTMGPIVAMGVATTFGVASTGTSISTLSGAAATNAALAWLGGGALAAGGGGMATGNAFLALASPVGWVIAGVSLLASGLIFWKSKSDKNHLENVFIAISERDIKSYELAIVELKERISRIIDENSKLTDAIGEIESFGLDYNKMSESQQYALGSYVNLMFSSTRLLVNPIQGLLPKFSEEDFDSFMSWKDRKANKETCAEHKDFIVSLANLLYKIEINDRDKKLLWKSLRKNKKMLKSMDISKKEFDLDIMSVILEALSFKYSKKVDTTI